MSASLKRPPPAAALPPEVLRIGEAIRAAGGRPVLVGGWVRDHLLGAAGGKDYDVEVFGLASGKLAKVLRTFGPVHSVGRHFGVLKLSTRSAEYDVSVPRREIKVADGHRGFQIATDPRMSFEEAASRRDFTINSMGYAFLEEHLLDPHGGRADLAARLLRHVGPSFGEDPLRVLRAMQLAGRFELAIAPQTLAICRAQDLGELPRERLWDEYKKLLLHARAPSRGLAYASPLGVLRYFPELERLHRAPRHGPAPTPWERTMAAVDQAAALRTHDAGTSLELMLAALCHQFGGLAEAEAEGAEGTGGTGDAEPMIRSFLARLTNEERVVAAVVTLVREYPVPQTLHRRGGEADSEVRRLALRVFLPHLVRLAKACHRAEAQLGAGPRRFSAGAWLTRRAKALGVWEGPPQPLLKGRHLLHLGIRSGRWMGPVLRRAFEKQLDGELRSLDEALAWAAPEAQAAARHSPEAT